ncbi:MAG: hypothetical protein AAF636_00765 [Pseudomonadota bacterium]
MMQKKEIVTAVGTIGCALGIGFVMQSGEVAEQRYGSLVMPLETNSDTKPLQVQDITLVSASVAPVQTFTFDDTPDLSFAPISPPAHENQVHTIASKPFCDVSLVAATRAVAMVNLSLSAPCFANENVIVSHGNMRFSATTKVDGTLNLTVPALTADATYEVAFIEGQTEAVNLRVDSVMLYDRVVVQWQGAQGLQLHAREYGASYGEDGHVWMDNPRDMTAITVEKGGFLTRHGGADNQNNHFAEVYTFPASLSDKKSAVNLTVEAEITATNCETQITGETLEVLGGKLMQSQNIEMMAPDCDAVGEYLVLNNLLRDLTVALR